LPGQDFDTPDRGELEVNPIRCKYLWTSGN
jgi:hypothetical protein